MLGLIMPPGDSRDGDRPAADGDPGDAALATVSVVMMARAAACQLSA